VFWEALSSAKYNVQLLETRTCPYLPLLENRPAKKEINTSSLLPLASPHHFHFPRPFFPSTVIKPEKEETSWSVEFRASLIEIKENLGGNKCIF